MTAPASPVTYPKRLIEVDLPIKRISEHARREKSIRHGHIATLHIWWARRPLAACRAVILAALWPDPADELCPARFREEAAARMKAFFATRDSRKRDWKDRLVVRQALLDFIADFANWDNSNDPLFLETSRALVQVAHEALGGTPGTRPLVVDPFAGGGAIPLKALRVGADAFASDLNPVAVLLNKVVLEYIPKYGKRLEDEVRKWGAWVKAEAAKELAPFYPKDPDGATPVAYLWARTIKREGPGCGAEVPLIRNFCLARKGSGGVWLRMVPDHARKQVGFQIDPGPRATDESEATIRKGAATCPICSYTTPNARLRGQLTTRHGGAADARLIAVVTSRDGGDRRGYRLPNLRDLKAMAHALERVNERRKQSHGALSPIPDEPIPSERPSPNARGLSAVTRIGMRTFGDVYTPRQALALATLGDLVRSVRAKIAAERGDPEFATAVSTCLAFVPNRCADFLTSLATWISAGEKIGHTFGRQALPIVWDFCEGNPLADISGAFARCLDYLLEVLAEHQGLALQAGHVQMASATSHPLPDDAAQAMVTDPPYYDAIPYADLSDFFYVWLRRSLNGEHADLLRENLTSKDEEAIWNPSRIYSKTGKPKDEQFYESQMGRAWVQGRRVTQPSGIGVVVFANKTTSGWEAILSALVESGWIATASWPIDTERGARVNAMGTASLASSVHIVCRPRENPDGSLRTDAIGDWRDVLAELPRRIHEWMPRLAAEGVVGADAIFACLGPALEVFSRYSRVERTSGEAVTLKEYLEHVWAAVAKEALTMIFAGADASGFEEDARLAAMWLWTLSTGGANGKDAASAEETDGSHEDAEEDDELESSGKKGGKAGAGGAVGGFVLEYDAARKIAQGLGAHLEDLTTLVAIKGDSARLLPVSERTRALFGKDDSGSPSAASARRNKKDPQLRLGFVAELAAAEADSVDGGGGWGEKNAPQLGKTVLDRLHQAMILFAAGRGEALRRFLVDEGVGRDERLWRLAQALSALYPPACEEKRWVDGVLARKKGLGL